MTRARLKWPYDKPFSIPEQALKHFRKAVARGGGLQSQWEAHLDEYRRAFSEDAEHLEQDLRGELPEDWADGLDALYKTEKEPVATREASGKVMNIIAQKVHTFTGGSADLAPSTKTELKDHGHYGFEEYCGHNMHFGVREHAMGAIANGMSLHGGTIPYTATFLIFSDYMRSPMRLAALMELQVIYIFTHDSIGLGEDGPTHQPIEHLLALRAVPNLVVLRPADATEAVEAWKVAMTRREGPTVLVLGRQNLPVLDRGELAPADGVRRGGYVLWEASEKADVILIGTGSEVHIAMAAAKLLHKDGVAARVVSLPSWELFDAQPASYRDSVLPLGIGARVSIEAATTLGWERYVGLEGVAVGIPHFGASTPAGVLYEKFGVIAQHLAEEANTLVASNKA